MTKCISKTQSKTKVDCRYYYYCSSSVQSVVQEMRPENSQSRKWESADFGVVSMAVQDNKKNMYEMRNSVYSSFSFQCHSFFSSFCLWSRCGFSAFGENQTNKGDHRRRYNVEGRSGESNVIVFGFKWNLLFFDYVRTFLAVFWCRWCGKIFHCSILRLVLVEALTRNKFTPAAAVASKINELIKLQSIRRFAFRFSHSAQCALWKVRIQYVRTQAHPITNIWDELETF